MKGLVGYKAYFGKRNTINYVSWTKTNIFAVSPDWPFTASALSKSVARHFSFPEIRQTADRNCEKAGRASQGYRTKFGLSCALANKSPFSLISGLPDWLFVYFSSKTYHCPSNLKEKRQINAVGTIKQLKTSSIFFSLFLSRFWARLKTANCNAQENARPLFF